MSNASGADLGLEIVVEPDVVPKGTVDLRALDAAPGTPVPSRRIEPDGRVFPIAPAPVAPAAAPAPIAASTADTTVAMKPDPEVLRNDALGARLRKKSSGIHHDTAMPPRPASASETGSSGRTRGAPLPADDYDTTIHGGIASPLWSLAKVTAALTFLFLATVLTYLYLNGLLPAFSPVATPALAVNPGNPQTPAPAVPTSGALTKAPETAPIPTQVAVTAPADKASVATAVSTASAGPAVGVVLDGEKKLEEPRVADATKKLVEVPKASSELGTEDDGIANKVEQLRKEGVIARRAGRLDEALAKFDALLAIKPNDPDALFQRALVIHRKKDLKGAIAAYEVAANFAAPRDARAFTNMGIIQEELGDLIAARKSYERALEHFPEDADSLTNLGRFKKETDPDGALALFDKALEANPRHPQARFHRATVLAFQLGRPEEARTTLLELASEDTRVKVEALDSLASLALRDGKPQDAVKLARKALEANPDFDQARLQLGVALYASDDAPGAEKELRAFLAKQPASFEGWKSLGACYVRMDQLSEAKRAYEKALDLNKKDASTLYNYALCAERFGNFLFAIQEYEHVIALDPNHWRALENIGRLYHRALRAEKALEYFDRALKVEPGNANLHLERANVLVTLKRTPEAKLELKEFVRLAPVDPRAEQARKAIDFPGELVAPTTEAPAGDRPRGF
jgi:tetratricopeptide (TPR) repeat protein